MRYYNTGTAPIYEVRPTTNFILKNANQSLTTIKAGPNQIGNSLSPGDTYPKQGQAPISLDKANEAGTTRFPLTGSNTPYCPLLCVVSKSMVSFLDWILSMEIL
ncbi:hypothetical protein ACUOAQ_35105 [Escherichia sp. SP-MK]